MAELTTSVDSIVTKSGLPRLDVVKFLVILVNISDSNRILTK